MVPPSSIRISRVPTYSSLAPLNALFKYGAITLFGWLFQTILLNHLTFHVTGLFPFRSPLLGKSRLISFPLGTEMFQFPRFASLDLCIQSRMIDLLLVGFPHSDIFGSMLVASSPKLFAGCHVFLRLLLPRHPPCALNLLDHITPSRLFSSSQHSVITHCYTVLLLTYSIQLDVTYSIVTSHSANVLHLAFIQLFKELCYLFRITELLKIFCFLYLLLLFQIVKDSLVPVS